MIAEALFDTGEIELNYAEGGSIGKPALVLVHGLTGRWQAYTEDFEVYGKDWHIYALDLRGHGKSSKPSEGYLLPDYARDVECFLRQKVAEPVVLAGHSLGGLVTLATASRVPEMVRALIANDPPLLGVDLRIDDYPWAKMSACKADNPNAGEADLRAMAERVYEVAPGTVKIALEDRQKENFDLPAALKHITCPALLLYGDLESGSAVRDRDAQEFQELVPQSVVRKIPGGNHGFWWEQADITRGYVLEFLSKV
jgi:pimeloyl-ACP methyl ester carboxylesterase